MESIHYGPDRRLRGPPTASGPSLTAGDPLAPFYPRSALKPLQAVAMVRAGLDLPADLLALAAASHSGGAAHRDGTQRILAMHGLAASDLENSTDLPYGVQRARGMAPRRRPRHPADPELLRQTRRHGRHLRHQRLAGHRATWTRPTRCSSWSRTPSAELTGEEPFARSTDGCGTPLFALTLRGMARAFGRIAAAAASAAPPTTAGRPDGAEAAVGLAMRQHPDMVAGESRDVTELMRLLPGSVAKDGFEGVQLVGLPDGRAVAVKISDGGDRARMPATVRVLEALGVDTAPLAGIGTAPVLGGGRTVGLLHPIHFLSKPVNEAP